MGTLNDQKQMQNKTFANIDLEECEKSKRNPTTRQKNGLAKCRERTDWGSDNMANFGPGWKFGPLAGLNFVAITRRISARAQCSKLGENICRKVFYIPFLCTTKEERMSKFIFHPGLKFECNYMRFFSPFDRAEISRKPSCNFSPGWNLPCNRPLNVMQSVMDEPFFPPLGGFICSIRVYLSHF